MAFDFPSAPTLGQTYTPTGGPTYVWNGTAWVVLSPGSSYSTTIFTATAGQTTFSTTYVVGSIYVYRNGVLLAPADFTATNGTSIVLANACNAGDTIEVINLAQVPYVNCVQKTGDTMTGNLNFSGNGLRITGDFSNATFANRMSFQTNATNGNSVVQVITNGTATTSALQALNSSDANNAAVANLVASSVSVSLESTARGTGVYVPLLLSTGGSERVRIDTSGNVGIGTSSPGTRLNVYSASDETIFRLEPGGAGAKAWDIISTSGGSGLGQGALSFYDRTASLERMRITTGGTVSIGGASPNTNARLDVRYGSGGGISGNNGTWAAQFIANQDTAGFGGISIQNRFASNNTAILEAATGWNGSSVGYYPLFTVYGQGNVRFGANDAGAMGNILSTGGDIFQWYANRNGTGSYFFYNTSNNYGTASDQRLKEDIAPISGDDAISFIKGIEPASFRLRDGSGDTLQAGFIAQNVLAACADDAEKSAVNNWQTYDPNDPDCPHLGVSDRPILANLVAAFNKAMQRIEQLEAEVASLKGTA